MATTGDGHGWVLAAVDAYELPLVRYARRLLGDADLAADAVQHAFVSLCGASPAVVGDRVAPWLFRVCRNRAIDHLRRAGRERSLVETEREADDTQPPAAKIADRGVDPATVAEGRELVSLLRELLRELPEPQREAIDLWCEGLTAKEIAAVTGRTEGHVRVLTHRGLTALRSHPAVRSQLAPAAASGNA